MERKKKSIVDCKFKSTYYLQRDRNTIDYFAEIRKYPILTAEEERELLFEVKNGSPLKAEMARERLVNCNQLFVASVAKKWANNDNFLDLINEGNIGLLVAIDRFDLNKKQRFLSYAVFWVRQYINDYIINCEHLVKPLNAHKIHIYKAKVTSELTQKLERVPTPDEIRDETEKKYGINLPFSMDFINFSVASIDAPFMMEDKDNEANGVCMAFDNVTATNNIDKDIEVLDACKRANKALGMLTPREKRILMKYYGIGHTRNYDVYEIAESEQKSKERIRQIIKHAIIKLKNRTAQINLI